MSTLSSVVAYSWKQHEQIEALQANVNELLAAMKSLVPGPDDDAMDYIPCVKAARSIIAKAEGRAP